MPIGWLDLFEGLFTLGQAALPGINKKGKQLKAWNETTYDTSFYVDDITEKKAGGLQLLKSIVTEESIEEGSFYRDDIEGVIKDTIFQKHLCVISGPEGRGKSTISQLIAYDFHKEGWDVFITKDNWRTEYLKSSVHDFQGIGSDRKCLFVLEDVHLLSEADLQKLVNTIEEIYIPKENLFFLMNMRPSAVKEELIDIDEDNIVELNDKDNSEFIRHLAALINKEPEALTINGKQALDASQTGNRRMLFYFFKELQKDGVDSVREEDILTKFSTAYQLGNDCQDELLFLSSLYQFEIPLPESFLDKDSRSVLNNYSNLGLCRKLGRFYYMPETTDARCLCKAICKRNREDYKDTTIEQVKLYYHKILESKNPSAFENDFRNLFTCLLKESEFSVLIGYFKEPEESKRIILSIYPGFILYALAFRPSYIMSQQETADRLGIYNETKDYLKNHIARIDEPVLNTLRYTLKNHYGYIDDEEHGLVKDMFPDHNSFIRYIESGKIIKHLNSGFRRRLKSISKETEDYLASIIHSAQNNVHQDIAQQSHTINRHHLNKRIKKYYHHTFYLISHGLYTLNQRTIESGDYDDYLMQAQLYATRVLNRDLLSVASSKNLSLFFYNLGYIDKGLLVDLLQEDLIIEDAKERIANLKLSILDNPDFYLLSHYYEKSENIELKNLIDHLLSDASNQQQEGMKTWIEEISHNKPFNEGSLAYAVEQALKSAKEET